MVPARDISVRPVDSARDWRDFFSLKDRLYRDDPHYVRPLEFQRRGQLDVRGNPFYAHAERQAFLCSQDARPVGRIAAIVDRMHQERYGDQLGCFGFWECPNDPLIAGALLDAAEDWLRDRGCAAIRGPLNPSMKSDFGVLVEGHDYPPHIMMAHTPAYYHDLLLGSGFEVIRSFHAFALHASDDRD
jgi:hypothetical protein